MNPKNFSKACIQLCKEHGIEIENIELFQTAFTHTSYANENKCENNERLEFLGDAILDFLVSKFLYENYSQMPEGEMSRTRSTYVCERANAEYALNLGLDKCLLLGKGEAEQGGASKPAILGDLFEAFLGAIYLNSGLEKVEELLDSVLFSKIEYIEKGFFEDYKSRLQEYVQAETRKGVTYALDYEDGPSHNKRFTVSVYHEGVRLGSGVGKSKKEAEQNAAKDALSKMVTL